VARRDRAHRIAREILLVEDNQDDIDLTLRAFARSNVAHQITIVRDGQEALDYLFAKCNDGQRDPAETPQVVLLDLKLPRVSGLEVSGALLPPDFLSFAPRVGDLHDS